MFNKFVPWNYCQTAAEPKTFSLSNSESVVNNSLGSQVQYAVSHTKSDSYVKMNGNNMHQSNHEKSDYAVSSKGTNMQENINKNYEYAVQPNGINVNQNIHKNYNDSQIQYYLHNSTNLHRKDFPNHPSSKLEQLLNCNGNTDSPQNKNSQYLNQNASNQQIRHYSKNNITSDENQFQSNVQHIELPNKNTPKQKNDTKICGEANVVPCNFIKDPAQFFNNLNKHENGFFNNNMSSVCTERNFANHNSTLQKKTEETFRQQIWVKNIESLNASTINEISNSSVPEKPNQSDYLHKICDTKVSQTIVGGNSVVEKYCFQTATTNICALNSKDKPLQNTIYKNMFSSNIVPNAVANNIETMNSIASVETQDLVNSNSNALKQTNENQNESNLDKIPNRSNKILNIVMKKTAMNLNVSNSVSENMELSNSYPIDFNEEENSNILHTKKRPKQTQLISSSLSFSCEEFENMADNTRKQKSANDLYHSFNNFQRYNEQGNKLMSNKNNCNTKKCRKRDFSLVNTSNETPNKNLSNIRHNLASNRKKEMQQMRQNENSSAISSNNIHSNNSENNKISTDKELNKAKKRKVSKASVQRHIDISSSKNPRKTKASASEGEAKRGKRTATNLKINKKDKYSVKENAGVNSYNGDRCLRSYPKKSYKRMTNNSKMKQMLHKEDKKGTDSLNEKKNYNNSNYRKQGRANTFHKNVHKTLAVADENKLDCAQESTTEVKTHIKKRGRKRGRKPIYFRNSLIDRKKLDLLIKYVEGNTNFRSPAHCDNMKNSEISCKDKDIAFGIKNTNGNSNENKNILDGAIAKSEKISVRPRDIKYENAFDVIDKKDPLMESKISQSSHFNSATTFLQRGSAAAGLVQVFKKCINDKDDSGTNSEAEELHDICMLANFEDKTIFSGNDMNDGESHIKVFDEKIQKLKHLGSNKCIGCESMIPMDKFWLKVSTGELKCAECLISRDRRVKEKKMQWKLLRENEELKLENLTLKHKIRKWIENKTIKTRKISDCHDCDKFGISSIPSDNLEKENKNYKSRGRRGRRKFMEIGGELENERPNKNSKNWHNAKACIKSKKRGRAALFKKHI